MSESLCLGRLINSPPKLTFSSPVDAKVVTHGPYGCSLNRFTNIRTSGETKEVPYK